MWSLADELVDLDHLASNDIYAILTVYGVEAARRAIIDEVSSVFGAYGIAVDYRHLTIIADYMVRGVLVTQLTCRHTPGVIDPSTGPAYQTNPLPCSKHRSRRRSSSCPTRCSMATMTISRVRRRG